MDYNLLANLEYCGAIVTEMLPLLLYTHVPAAVIAIIVGTFVLSKSRTDTSFLLFALSLVFGLWVGINLSLWLLYDQNTPLIALWALLPLISTWMFFLTHWFGHRYLTDEPLPLWPLIIWLLAMAPVIVYTPTSLNLSGVDIRECVAVEGEWFVGYYHALGILAMALLALSAYRGLVRKKKESEESHSAKWMVFAGAELFLLAFLTTGVLASYLVGSGLIPDFGLEQYGVATMAVFMGILAYATVRYHAFNLKLIAAQALVIALVILIAAQFFYVSTVTAFFLVTLTLFLGVVFGFFLVRSVKEEVRQREEIEKLSAEKSEFMTFASHEIRNPITAMRGYASLIVDGTAGEMSAKVKDVAEKILVEGNAVLALIAQYLSKSKMELGQISYNRAPFNVCAAVAGIVDSYLPHAEQKGLALIKKCDAEEKLMIDADEGKIREVVGNIIDNSMKYTKEGSVSVAVERHGVGIRIVVSDTGVGIAPETLPHLFKKFSRADAERANLLGTGVGLYLAKTFIEAQGGRIWAESDGKDKGSRFIMEFPASHSNAA